MKNEMEGFMKGEGGVFGLGWCVEVVKPMWGCEGMTRGLIGVVGGRERVERGLILQGRGWSVVLG